jgi:hypothetical protein
MKTAVYHNRKTNETYQLVGIKNLAHAWKVYNTVCERMNWNPEMFSNDVNVKIK